MSRVPASVAVAATIALATLTARADDPSRSWFSLDTPHFVITYHSGEERIARRLAIVAEEAHRRLVPLFDHAPKHRTQVVLTDYTDDANGSATVYPYQAVRLYATAPDDRSELNDYDDWLGELVTHEYTHIVHLDTVHGVARVINFILGFGEHGQLYAPNNAQPSFILEGMAEFEETARTSGGRLRSSIWDMYLRTAVLDGKMQRLDQFSTFPIQWPRSNSPHFMGGMFMGWIARTFGPDVLRRLSHEYGGTVIPGSMNRALRRVTGGKKRGITFTQAYEQFDRAMKSRYREQLDAVEAAGRIEGTPLTGPRDYAARPTFTPDGKEVVWADSDGYVRPQLRRTAVDGGPLRTMLLVDGAGGSAFAADGRTLYFNALEVFRTFYFFNDLFALDVETGVKRQLTHGLRAAEPALSPDGKTLAFNVNLASSRTLAIMPVDTLEAEGGAAPTILVGNRDDLSQVYTPAWSPDGRTIAFSWWRDGGYRDIWTIDVATRELHRITADRALDVDPRYSPDGKYLYFCSDRTGIYNLYALELATGATWQVTNVIGGVFDPAISPDGRRAVYVGFVADGWRLERIELDPTRWRPAPAAPADRPEADEPPGISNVHARPYQPGQTMWPHTWNASLQPDAFGQTLVLTLNGGDIVGHHAWSLGLGFSFGRADAISVATSYVYAGLFPSFGFSAYRAMTRRGGYVVDGVNRAYIEDDYSASVSVDFPFLRRIDQASDLAFGYNLAYLRPAEHPAIPLDPSTITPRLPEIGRVASFGVGWAYTNVRRFTFSVSPAMGRSLGVNVGFSSKAIGSQYNVVSASWRYTEFIPFFFQSHVLALSYAGGISGGQLGHRGVFFLGGYPPQNDILRSAFDFTRPGGAALRGYPFGSVYGDQFHVANLEYRFPIAWIERGYQTLPLYLRRLHGAAFADYGGAFFGTFDIKKFKVGVGAELRLEIFLGYDFPAALQFGYARGLMDGGENQVYFYLNNPF